MESSDDDVITPEEAIMNTLNTNISEEVKISFIRSILDTNPTTDINYQNRKGDTCLHIAIRKHELEVVQLLLDFGARKDVKNRKNEMQSETADKEGITLEDPSQSPEEESVLERSKSVEYQSEDKASCSSKQSYCPEEVQERNISKRRKVDTEDVNQTIPRDDLKYSASGLKNTLHGTVYQLKLLLLYWWRGLQLGYSFKLATEMVAAEKFDDIVFQYSKNGKDICSFLQAKHKHNYDKIREKSIVITKKDLLTEKDGEFSVLKYFISYRKIVRNPLFKNKDLTDFIICTNIDMDSNLDSCFEEIPPHDILKYRNITNRPRYLKFKIVDNSENTSDMKQLVLTLQGASDVNRLAKSLAMCIYQSKPLELRDDIKVYQSVLSEVIYIENTLRYKKHKNGKVCGKFHSHFIDGTSQSMTSFRNAFENIYLNIDKGIKKQEFWQKMKEKEIHTSQQFGKLKKDSDHKANFQLDDIITDEECKEFLNKLVFAVNQPNELELSEIIESELREYKDINLIDTEFIANKFQTDMLNWMKNKEGRFLTHEEGKSWFENAKCSISKLMLIGPTLEYGAKIQDYGVEFQTDSPELQDFLNSREVHIFNLVCRDQVILSSIKAYQTIRHSPDYRKKDSYIFIRLSSLLRMKKQVVEAFKCKGKNSLLVIECDAVESDIKELFSELYSCISKEMSTMNCKKVILVSQRDDPLAEKLKNSPLGYNYMAKIDEKNNFDNLTSKSKNKILEQEVIFQEHPTSIRSLVNDETKCLLDEHVLTKLISNDDIEVGQSITNSKYEDMKSYYIERKVYRHIKIKKEFETPKFLVTNTVDNKYTHLVPGQEIVLISDNEQDFIAIYKKFKKNNVHWLRRQESNYILQKSRGNADQISKFAKPGSQKDGKILIRKDFKQAKMSNFIVVYDEQNINVKIYSNPESDRRDIVLVSNSSERFTALCKKYNKYNIHRLEKNGSVFIWRESRGDLTKLRNYIDEEDNEKDDKSCSVDKLTDITDKVVIIAAEPGMGKSTILTHLAVEEKLCENPSKLWIVRINLLDFSAEFSTWTEETNTGINLDKVLQFLYITLDFQSFRNVDKANKKTILNKIIVRNGSKLVLKPRVSQSLNSLQLLEIGLFIDYFNNGHVALLFDGFDEISPDYNDIVLELLHTITNLKIKKIWITTRPYNIQNELENRLGVFSYSLMQFTAEDQRNFLRGFWKHSTKMKENAESLNAIADELQDRFSESIQDPNSELVSIPLQLWMIATIYQDSLNNFHSETKSLTDYIKKELKMLDLAKMYEQFIEKKF